MSRKIGVFLNEEGKPENLFNSRFVKVFEKQAAGWLVAAEYEVNVDMNKGMAHVRQGINSLLTQLEDTNIIVGREVSGMAYSLFQQANFHVFEATEAPENFLDEVLDVVEEAEAASNKVEARFEPQQVNEQGNYFADLRELQIQRPGLTSKQALLPFLKETQFRELVVACAHVPKWFDQLLSGLGLQYEAVEIGHNDFKVTICPKDKA